MPLPLIRRRLRGKHINPLPKKLVTGFLRPVNRTGSCQDEQTQSQVNTHSNFGERIWKRRSRMNREGKNEVEFPAEGDSKHARPCII